MPGISPRQRVYQCLDHHQPDHIPYHFEFTEPARIKLTTYYNSSNLDDILGNHLAKTKVTRLKQFWQEVSPGIWMDEFGVVWNRRVDPDVGMVQNCILADKSALKSYRFPDPLAPYRYEHLDVFINAERDRFRLINLGFSLFERAWTLRGMENLLVDMAEDPGWVEDLLDSILEFNKPLLDRIVHLDIDGIMFGDDWGQQNGLIFSQKMWRRFIQPRIAQMYSIVRRAGKKVFIHSCGKIQSLIPDLIDCGVDVLNPFQPDVMDVYEIKKQFGEKLSFYGGVSVQSLLPLATPQQIKEEVQRLITEVGEGGGFIIAPSHAMPGDIPIQNLISFIEAIQQFG